MSRYTSSHAEQNHASVLERLGTSFVQIPDFIHKLMKRQSQMDIEINNLITTYYLNTMAESIQVERSQEYKQSVKMFYTAQASFDARKYLTKWGYEIAAECIKQSKRYTVISTNSYYQVSRKNSNHTARIINFNERCQCETVTMFNDFQCRHEFAIHKKLRKSYSMSRGLSYKNLGDLQFLQMICIPILRIPII